MVNDLIIKEVNRQISAGILKDKNEVLNIVIQMEQKLLSDKKLMALLETKGMPLKEGNYKVFIEQLLESFDQSKQRVENITKYEDDNKQLVGFDSKDEYVIANNYSDIDPQERLQKIQNEQLKTGQKITDEEVFDKYQQQNKTYELYSIEARKGHEMNQDALRNLNVFISAALDQGLDINDYQTTYDCTTYINQTNGNIYTVNAGQLIQMKRIDSDQKIQEEKVISDIERELLSLDSEQLQTKLERYTDDELVQLYGTMSNEDLKEVIKKMISEDYTFDEETSTFTRVTAAKVYKLEKKDTNKAAFVNVLILSIVSFAFSILMIFLMLIKSNL